MKRRPSSQSSAIETSAQHEDEPCFQACEPRLVLSGQPLLDGLAPFVSGASWLPMEAQVQELSTASPMAGESAASPTSPPVHPQQSTAERLLAGDNRNVFGLAGGGQTVAVIDSGITWDHIALGKGFGPGYRVVGGWDFAEDDALPYDDGPNGFHGTHVAGIIAGDHPRATGLARDVDLVALRVFDDVGQGRLEWVERALRWVHDHRASFEHPITSVNLSIGTLWSAEQIPEQQSLDDELKLLHDAGIVVTAAAGNSYESSGTGELSYPASSEYVLPVGSVDENGAISAFSQRGEGVLFAPGSEIVSTVPDHVLGRDGKLDDFAAGSGTSMAAPYASAASALVRQAFWLSGQTDVTTDQITDHLRETADLVRDPVSGEYYPSINIEEAIASLLPNARIEEHGDTGLAQDIDPSLALLNAPASQVGEPIDRNVGIVDYFSEEVAAGTSLSAVAMRDGLFTVQWNASGAESPANGAATIVIESSAGQRWFADEWRADTIRIDVPVAAGDDLRIQLPDVPSAKGAPAGELTLANSVSQQGSSVHVLGTSRQDQFAIELGNHIHLQHGKIEYVFSTDEVTEVTIDGQGSADHLTALGSQQIERVQLIPGNASISNRLANLQVLDVENVLYTSGGGNDRVYLYDSDTDDTLRASPGTTELVGVGYHFETRDVPRVFIHATGAGEDTAYLYDSSGDDRLSSRPQFTSFSGVGFFNYVRGFERVYAYANNGGLDRADLYDSQASDRFITSGVSASMVGAGFTSRTRAFEVVHAHATAGGLDTALLYATNTQPHGSELSYSEVVWRRGNDVLSLESDGWHREARGFQEVKTFEDGVRLQTLNTSIDSSAETQPQNETRHSQTVPGYETLAVDEAALRELHLPEEEVLAQSSMERGLLDEAFRQFEENHE